MTTCDCKSYNWDIGKKPEVILPLPDEIDTERRNRTVCVDACIVHVILYLWKHDIQTLGCCCGHNRTGPCVVITDGYKYADWWRIRWLIEEVDERQWGILQWQLRDVMTGEEAK